MVVPVVAMTTMVAMVPTSMPTSMPTSTSMAMKERLIPIKTPSTATATPRKCDSFQIFVTAMT